MRDRPRFRRLFRLPWRSADRIAEDVDAELQFHMDERTRDLRTGGLATGEAVRQAHREFGDVERARVRLRAEDARHERRARLGRRLDEVAQDARYAARQLRAAPGFAVVALLTFALGIGANATIFSVVNGVLLRPLPFPDPDRVVRVFETTPAGERITVTPANFVDWHTRSRSFAGLAALTGGRASLTRPGADAENVQRVHASADLFRVVGVRPLLGRGFVEGDDRWGGPRIAVLDEGLWRRAFGADPDILGRTVVLDAEPHTVVGVMPAGRGFPFEAELWTPLAFDPADLPGSRGAHYLRVVGRLAPGATVEAATSEMDAIAGRLKRQYPDGGIGDGATVATAHEILVGDVRTPLLVLLGAVGLVLLVACANVANLLLARGVGRAGELAMRAALGAGRGRLARQLVTESVVLALMGGVLGAGLAVLGTRAFVHLAPADVPRLDAVRVDGTVLLATLLAATVVGVLAGLAPALQGGRASLDRMLREAGRGGAGRGGLRLVDTIAAAELALAVVLLVGAGLLVRSFDALRSVNPGFEPERVLTFGVQLPDATYETRDEQRAFIGALLERVRALPETEVAGATFVLPLGRGGYGISVETVGGEPLVVADGPQPSAEVRAVTPDYFRALRIPVRRGRVVADADRAGATPALVVNETFVRRIFGEREPIGERVTFGWTRDSVRFGGTIVGVVGDVRQFGLDVAIEPEVYMAYDQWPVSDVSVVVRTAGDPAAAAAGVRAAVRALDPTLPVADLAALDHVVAESVARPRFYTVLLGGFAAAALLLASVGVYGVIAYAVGRRTREIGVRMALGATAGRVQREVVRRGLAIGAVGLAAGGLGALLATRLLRGLLFGVSATDPLSFGAAAAVLLGVALLAAWVPARRAARVSPLAAMRQE